MMMAINLLMLTLAYPPASGGASIYTQLLAEGLLKQEFLGKIVVLVERYPNFPKKEISYNQRLYLLRYFPFRSELSRSNPLRYVKYFYQNLQFFLLFYWIAKFKITHLLIHCHYYYSPSLLPLTIKFIQKIFKTKLILDVRDPKLSKAKFSQVCLYDKIICCSRNIYNYLAQDSLLVPKLSLIPVPFQSITTHQSSIKYYQNKYQLTHQCYLFSASGILQEKNLDFTLKVMQELKNMQPELILVIAGVEKDKSEQYQSAIKTGLVKYIGVIPHEAVFALAASAEIVINFSKIESPSRYILEAIAVGSKVLLPPNVPEFVASDPDKIVQSDNPKEVAQQIVTLLQTPNYRLNYNLDIHSLDNVIPQYLNLFSETIDDGA